MIRIAVVDDHQLYRKSLIILINEFENCEVVLQGENGLGLTDKLKETEVDVLVLDLMMPKKDGIVTCEEVTELFPDVKILIISMLDDCVTVSKLIKKGASGYLTKNCSDVELNSAILRLHNGGNVFSYELKTLLNPMLVIREDDDGRINYVSITKREKIILELICEQNTNDEIADELKVSIRSIEYYRQKIIEKTASKNIIGAIVYANRHNLIDLD